MLLASALVSPSSIFSISRVIVRWTCGVPILVSLVDGLRVHTSHIPPKMVMLE